MKIARFKVNDQIYYGEIKGEQVYTIEGDIFAEYRVTKQAFALKDVKLLAPLEPGKIICVGLNYLSHVQDKAGREVSEEPIIFMTSPSAVIGPEDPIVIPYPEHITHHEAELTVVIGKVARDVKPEDALEYVFGYTCGNDVSDRTLQKKDGQWTRAKSFHTFKPIGPYITTELDLSDCSVVAKVNGQIVQNGNTSLLIRDVNQLISFITKVMTLYPGDIIMTGTPGGPGPIAPNDICEIEVGGMVLKNPVTSAKYTQKL